MRKLTASATPKTDIQITAGADHCDVTMPRAQRGMLVENLKKKKETQTTANVKGAQSAL